MAPFNTSIVLASETVRNYAGLEPFDHNQIRYTVLNGATGLPVPGVAVAFFSNGEASFTLSGVQTYDNTTTTDSRGEVLLFVRSEYPGALTIYGNIVGVNDIQSAVLVQFAE